MKVGVPTEIKADEYRVALTPVGVRELAERGHEVLIQAGAGEGSAIADADYEAQGARIVPDAEAVFGEAELVLKVKEPQPEEVALLRPEQTLFTYLHLGAGARADARAARLGRDLRRLRDRRGPARPAAAARADERDRRQDRHPGRRLHAREAARRPRHPARRRARGGAGERDDHRRRRGRDERRLHRDRHGGRRVRLRHARSTACASSTSPSAGAPRPSSPRRSRSRSCCPSADLVIGAVLIHGARAPHVITRDAAEADEAARGARRRRDRPGRLLRDLAPTTHRDPTFEVDGVIHYCVTNMPGAVPITSTYALTNATLPYVLALADHGVAEAARRDPGLGLGVNVAARQGHPSGRRRGRGHGLCAPGGGARSDT